MADQTDRRPVLFSPSTYERHDRAVNEVAQEILTRNPRRGVRRFPGLAPGLWGLLESPGTIAACSGTTLGTGQVTLCDREGTPHPEGRTVTVYNAGGEIGTDEGSRIVPLEWTAGDWSVCGCVAPAEDFCSDIPTHDLTATLYGYDWELGEPIEEPIEVTLTYHPADPPIFPVPRWEFTGDTFLDPSGLTTLDRIRINCVTGEIGVELEADGVTNVLIPPDVTADPFHAEVTDMAPSGTSPWGGSRYTAIYIDDPTPP